ncbi:sigma factor-like helix-turn-helix DNA-binding protein [Hespellia stercorisuis]|uniref:RNA polymerase sigma-70 factor, ECF subfamily n=1 Tax=Hespellia stercorisuis DSM 15480 TaxID=1121950 RepID=A0A1M6I8M6_9FIRM|nr:sigma factor-like helix-turn-helix DNA-binding protein [Hespellia stercorisuis]SHJ30804.1 RNA polymerase sigma-70 factor, ECF subfamily [Hespellia stercorisuis DSM 15480]
MGYNKAQAEAIWKQWKEKEELLLRKEGASEEMIERLRQSDWEDFKAERRYREHTRVFLEDVELPGGDIAGPEMEDINVLLNCIENQQLLYILLTADKKTQELIVLRMRGYQIKEIAAMTGTPEQTLYTRLNRLKKKIKKLLEGE